jgi:hypothetical protein
MEDSKELKVITKAMELVKHSYTLTSNCNRYPKKYRFSLVDRIQLKSMDIYEKLMEANRMQIVEERAERSKLQTEAITCCDELLFYIELSKELELISWNSTEYWSKLVTDVKYMTIAWRKTDKKR